MYVFAMGGGGGKLYAHGNLVPGRKKGGLGEVCFLLDLENVSLSPLPSPRPSLSASFHGNFSHLYGDHKKESWRS